MNNTLLPVGKLLNQYFPSFEESLKQFLETKCLVKTFEENEIIMRTGQHFKYSMLIATGRIKLYRESEEGSEVFMYELESGNACALSMICAAQNEESQILAKVVEKTTAILIPVQLMDELMKNYRSWYHFVIDTYRTRFEELLNVLDQVVFKGMDERLKFYLKNQKEKTGSSEIKITHLEIANDLNTSREVVSRLLKKMEQNGIIQLQRNVIIWN